MFACSMHRVLWRGGWVLPGVVQPQREREAGHKAKPGSVVDAGLSAVCLYCERPITRARARKGERWTDGPR